MNGIPNPRKPMQSVEGKPLSIESTGFSIDEKVDALIQTAVDVRHALNRRTAIIIIAIIIPLITGAVLLGLSVAATATTKRVADTNQRIAKQAYVQALVNNRDFLQYRKDFAQTRDCPVEYFRDLLTVSRERGDLTTVVPPCDTIDTTEIDAKIARVDQLIAAAQ